MKFRKSMNCKISLEKKMPIDLTRPDIFRKIDLHGSSNQFKPQLRSKSSVDFYKKATTDGVFYSGRSRSSLSLQLRISKSLSSSDHYGCFWKFFVQKVFEKNHNFTYEGVQNQKKLSHICDVNFKTCYIMSVFSFFWFFTHRHLKLRFVSNTFWSKIQKISHSEIQAHRL